MTKHDIEEQLATLATGGVIVEIGNGEGHGLLALHRGNKNNLPIYGIDSYQPCIDLLGGTYGPETELKAIENTRPIPNLTRIKQSALEAAKDWTLPVALLWFDISLSYPEVKAIIDAWAPHITPDGLIGLAGFFYGQLGAPRVAAEYWASGWERLLPEQDLVAVLRKKPRQLRRAAFYIADGNRYADEAAYSARSVEDKLGLETVLFTNVDTNGFERVVKLPPRKYSGWYRNQVWYFIQAVDYLKDYDQLLYLDTDTYVCRDCSSIWRILNHYDMAFGHAAGRGATPTAVDCPSEFATLGVGVNFFRNTRLVRNLLADWLAMYEAHYEVYGETDEGPFRDLLFLNKNNLSYFVLAPEEHCRFGFGVWLNGSVSILHGRVDTPLSEIAREINAVTTMRIYRYNGKGTNGMLWYHKAS